MSSDGLTKIDEPECYGLLRTRRLGRIGFRHGDQVLVLPVFYALDGHDIVFRTSPGAKLDAAVLGTRVAFEVDDEHDGWSVLVSGHAAEVRDANEKQRARAVLGRAWPAGERELIVRISGEHVSGRRIPVAAISLVDQPLSDNRLNSTAH